MTIEVKVPLLPESISDATVSTWHKKEGDKVSRDENIVDLETDKVMLEVPSPADGIIKKINKSNGSTVQAQEVIAVIDDAAAEAKPEEKLKLKQKLQQKLKHRKQPNQQQRRSLSPSARRAVTEHKC